MTCKKCGHEWKPLIQNPKKCPHCTCRKWWLPIRELRPIVIGETFSRLTVVKHLASENSKRFVLCKCSCGTEFGVKFSALISGNTRSCGCLQRETVSRAARLKKKHGFSNTRLYYIWASMKSRCDHPTNTSYPWYGKLGVTVCKRWRDSFAAFYQDMGPRPSEKHSIDRINPYGNYEPSNCRWATRAEQRLNQRRMVA